MSVLDWIIVWCFVLHMGDKIGDIAKAIRDKDMK